MEIQSLELIFTDYEFNEADLDSYKGYRYKAANDDINFFQNWLEKYRGMEITAYE